jgi:hypothetical protein
MCTMSMVADDYLRRMGPTVIPGWQPGQPVTTPFVNITLVSRDEFDALKREVEELKLLLQAAKRYDEKTGQPDCENADKLALIKRVAEALGVDLSGLAA